MRDKPEHPAVYFDDTGRYFEELSKTYAEHPELLPQLCELAYKPPEEIQEEICEELSLSVINVAEKETPVPALSLAPEIFFQNLNNNLNESQRKNLEDFMMDFIAEGISSYQFEQHETQLLEEKLQQDGLLQEKEPYLFLRERISYFDAEIQAVETAEDLMDALSELPEVRITRAQKAPCFEVSVPVLSSAQPEPILIVPSSWIPEAVKDPKINEKIQKGMDCDPRIQDVVYQKAPSLYTGQMVRRALRDCLVYKTESDSIFADLHLDELARKVLSFDSDTFLKQAVMDCGYIPDNPRDPYYLAHLWETCRDEIWECLAYDSLQDTPNRPIPASKEEFQSVIDCLKRGRPQEIEQLAAAYAAKDREDLIPKAIFAKEANYQAERAAYRTYFQNFRRKDWPEDVESYLMMVQQEGQSSFPKMVLDDPFEFDSLEHAAKSAQTLKEDILQFTKVGRTQEEMDAFAKKRAQQCYFQSANERYPFLAQHTSRDLMHHYVPSTQKTIQKVVERLQILRKAYHLDQENVRSNGNKTSAAKKKKESAVIR